MTILKIATNPPVKVNTDSISDKDYRRALELGLELMIRTGEIEAISIAVHSSVNAKRKGQGLVRDRV